MWLILTVLSLASMVLNAGVPLAGVVQPEVKCLADSTHTYALYVPSYYDDDPYLEWPVIYAFDAAARGSLAVELFREAAEKYGYIIAGSNVSENGPWEPILKAAEIMMKDVESRFRIDKTRRYTTGFSGGARVATTLAVLYGTFEGVIGCGAGFSPNYPPHFDLQISYIGLVGNRDFNYQEMMKLDERLTKYNIDHYIYEFAGGHEWPPAEVITNAVTWLEFKAMKNDLKWTDYGMREDFYEEHMDLINSYMSQALYYAAYREALELESYLGGVRKLNDLDDVIKDLKNNNEVREQVLNLKKVLEEERGYYKEYLDAFALLKQSYEDGMTNVKSLTWWKEQVKLANKKINEGKNPADYLLGSRMIDFLWRMSYQQYETVMGTEYEPVAKSYLEIWAIVQPDAISPYFYMARYYASIGKTTKAIDYLKSAVDRGLDDPGLIERDTVLARLVDLPEYRPISARISN